MLIFASRGRYGAYPHHLGSAPSQPGPNQKAQGIMSAGHAPFTDSFTRTAAGTGNPASPDGAAQEML
jgi:hypothetical protein